MRRKRYLVLSVLLFACFASAAGCAKKRGMAGKAEELMNFQATEKLDPNARIGQKVAVVQLSHDTPVFLEGFNPDGTEDIVRFFFSPRRKAQSPEEIDTLVKINCGKGKPISSSSTVKYSQECEVSLIDYKTRTIFAREKFENSSAMVADGSDPELAREPSEEMKAYLRRFSTYD